MVHPSIIVRGARANNLRDVSIDVPKHKLVVFTGVSGSGKSSLVFQTIAAEAQRQLNETFSAFVRQRLPHYGAPDVDHVDGLSTAVIVDQKRLAGSSRSTVGTVTDLNPLLRLLFSRVGSPTVFPSNRLSFNDPDGMCPRCRGAGTTTEADPDKLVDWSLSLDKGALLHPTMNVGTWPWRMYARAGFDRRRPVGQWSKADRDLFLYADEPEYEGLVTRFNRIYVDRDPAEVSEAYLRSFDRFAITGTCTLCHGTRLSQEALACRIDGRNIADWCALDVIALRPVVQAVRGDADAAPIVAEVDDRLEQMERIGLGYLTLDRPTPTLSGGESQRIKMVRHLASSLVELMYVFDEPTVGLHPADVDQVVTLLRRLRDRGNTVLVVEHDRDVIRAADHVIDMGPLAGARGGYVTWEGTVAGLRSSGTRTGDLLDERPRLSRTPRAATGHLHVAPVTANNLRGVSVDVPTGVLVKAASGVRAARGTARAGRGTARARAAGARRSTA